MGKKFKDSEGKEWDLDQFDDARSWSKVKKDKGFYGHLNLKKIKRVKIHGCGRKF
jgi:hypothetical protein